MWQLNGHMTPEAVKLSEYAAVSQIVHMLCDNIYL